jgi:AmmeMemoRadiSam system protein B
MRLAVPLQCLAFMLLMLTAGDHASASQRCIVRCSARPYPSLYQDPAIFATAIRHAARPAEASGAISGITVPHHLLAADLIASAFKLVEGQTVDKVVLLFPDHFRRTHLPFAATRRDFDTVFGIVRTRYSDVTRILKASGLIEESDLFEKDHGIGAILPFVKHALPNAEVIPIAVAISSTRADWDRLVPILSTVISANTLVVQSTDFSHYLPFGEAVRRDQRSLNVLASGNLDEVAQLSQPQNLDSRGAQYIQLRLQREQFHADPIVLFNSNQQAYSEVPQAETTSYVVEVYGRRATGHVAADGPGSKVYCFAGDTFLGRGLAHLLRRPQVAARVLKAARDVLNGCRLVLNLEGVAVAQVPLNIPPEKLAMPKPLVLEWLRALNVVAVSLANNHTEDLGGDELEVMTRDLRAGGLTALRHGDEADLGSFRLVVLTDLDNSRHLLSGAITADVLEQVAHSPARPPLIAFLHWGTEFDPMPDPRDYAIAEALRRGAVALIVGAHPHVATPRLERTFTGWIAPALCWRTYSITSSARPSSDAGPQGQAPRRS